MKYLHTMIRASNLEQTMDFFCDKLGLVEVSRYDAAPGDIDSGTGEEQSPLDKSPLVEITHNWDPEEYDGGRNFGHLAYSVKDIYALCQQLMDKGLVINRPPRDGHMAFIRSPDGISVELLQEGDALPPREPWASMENTGSW
jgi:lactoylglutathione lyase